ncbi:Acetyl-coenzyme A carboxylase carboxyl transferase subunit beta, chloroplastic [Streptomyces violaceorubidus]
MAERLTAREFLALVTDDATFAELPHADGAWPPDGPLGWPGYDASRARAAERTGEAESAVCGTGRVEGTRAVLVSFEFGFLGGSLGHRTGDRIEAAYAYAREHRLPVVPLVATGGSRMQEGMLALTQLQRVARQSALTRAAGLAQIAVVRDPATGGGWATLGAGADVVLALPGAQVGFAGSRVRPPDADPAAYTAEAQLAAGSVDAVVPPGELRATLGRWLRLLAAPSDGPAPVPGPLGVRDLPADGWEAVRRARAAGRPRAGAYLDAYFTDRVALSGDRCGGRDAEGMLCGFGTHAGRTVAYARPDGHGDPARRVPHGDPAAPSRGPARHPGADPGGHPGRGQRRGGGAGGGGSGGRGPVRCHGLGAHAGHHAGDRRGRLGRGAGPGRAGQDLGDPGQLLLRHRAGARGGDPEAPARGGGGDGRSTAAAPAGLGPAWRDPNKRAGVPWNR